MIVSQEPWPWTHGSPEALSPSRPPWISWGLGVARLLGTPMDLAPLLDAALAAHPDLVTLEGLLPDGARTRPLLRHQASPAALAFGLPSWVMGEDGERWIRFARALEPAADLLAALQGHLESPPSGRLDALPLSDPGDLLLALASPEPDPDQVQGALAASLPGLDRAFQEHLDRARALLPHPELEPLLRGLLGRFRWVASYLQFRSLVAPPPWSGVEADEAVADAVAWLEETRPWRTSWEVRRRGLLGRGGHLVGQWFHRGLVLKALLDAGAPVQDELGRLLDEADPEGPRWFGAWRGIPPDADSLGLALDLSARLGRAPCPGWLKPMEASFFREEGGDLGHTVTWFTQGPRGSTVDPPPIAYRGHHCVAVRLALTLGLLAAGLRPVARANLASLRAAWDGSRLVGTWFYPPAWTDHLLLRLLALEPQELAFLREPLLERLLQEQQVDGSWGSPQSTALVLHGLCQARPAHTLALARGARYLCETRRPDGSWPAEPLYRMPAAGWGHRETWFSGPEVTTALVLGALVAWIQAGRPGIRA